MLALEYEARKVRVALPWPKPPISQNDRQNHVVKAKVVARVLGEARAAVRAAGLDPMQRVSVVLNYRVPDRRRRDADNLAVVLKVVQDALVAEGVLSRDDWVCVPSSGQVIHPPDGEPAMWVELIDLGAL